MNEEVEKLRARVRLLERQLLAHQSGMTVEGCQCQVCRERREIARLRAARISGNNVPRWRCAPGTHVRFREEDGCAYCGLTGPDSRRAKKTGAGENK